MQIRWPFLFVVLLASGLCWGAAPALAEDVGQFTRVVNQVDQLKKGKAPAVPAKVPGGVANQDMVSTKAKALAVVQFVDDSTITISPKSKVTIEDYMYDAQKARNKGTIKILQGVVETIIPTTDKLQQKDIQIFTTTAIAGIRGTRVVTVALPEGSIFYVLPDPKQVKPEKSKIRIRMYAPDVMPEAPTMRFVAERLKKKMPLRQLVEEALEAGLDPCEVIKAAILQGVKVEDLAEAFQKVCSGDPEYKEFCTSCLILKCTVEALRTLKEVEISEGQFCIVMKNMAPIVGDINPEDLDAIAILATTGIEGPLPYYPLSPKQLDQAKLPQETQQVYTALVNAGAPAEDLRACMDAMGIPAETFAFAPPPPAPGLGGGGGPGVPPLVPPVSPFK